MKLGKDINDIEKVNLAELSSSISELRNIFTKVLLVNPITYEIHDIPGYSLRKTNCDCRKTCPLVHDKCGCICRDSLSNNQNRSRFFYTSTEAYFIMTKPIKVNYDELNMVFIMKLDPTFSFGVNSIDDAVGNIVKLSSNLVIDPLTNIYNRKYLMDNIEYLMQSSAKQQKPLCLASIDIDNFKKFNDTYGHDFGDKVLQSVANAMIECVKGTKAIPVRIGGDEFEIIGNDIPKSQFKTMMTSLCMTVENTKLKYETQMVGIRISIGIAEMLSDKAYNFKQLYDIADKHLYMAKEAGKGCVR